jgi:hypothetical protein
MRMQHSQLCSHPLNRTSPCQRSSPHPSLGRKHCILQFTDPKKAACPRIRPINPAGMFQAFSHLEQTQTKNERRIMKPDRISHNNRHHSFQQNQDAEDAAASDKNRGKKTAAAETGQDSKQSATPVPSEQATQPPDTGEKTKPRPKKTPPLDLPPRTQQSDSP